MATDDFCRIVKGTLPARVIRRWEDAIAILPRDPSLRELPPEDSHYPKGDRHILVIAHEHAQDMPHSSRLAGLVAGTCRRTGQRARVDGRAFCLQLRPVGSPDGAPPVWTSGARRRTTPAHDAVVRRAAPRRRRLLHHRQRGHPTVAGAGGRPHTCRVQVHPRPEGPVALADDHGSAEAHPTGWMTWGCNAGHVSAILHAFHARHAPTGARIATNRHGRARPSLGESPRTRG